MPEILDAIVVFLGAVIGGAITVLLGPWVSQQFKIKENYIVPFLKWCTEFYGDLFEFESRYVGKNSIFDEFSDILVILDYRQLHDSLIDSHKWLGKISKEKKEAADCITNLIETVDKLWHQLENDYPDILPSVNSVKDFNSHIKLILSGEKKEKIAQVAKKIRNDLLEKPEKYKSDDFDTILKYLKKKVP